MSIIPETHNRGFSQQLCQSMIHMMDKDYNGKLNFEEFKALWVDVRNWKVIMVLPVEFSLFLEYNLNTYLKIEAIESYFC